MLNKIKNDLFSWLVLFSILLLLLEVLFFNKGLIFSLLLAAGMVYYGRKRIEQNRKRGKFIFWCGIVFFSISVFGMITFRLLLLAIFIYLVIQFAQSKKNPKIELPIIKNPMEFDPFSKENLVHQQPLFKNVLFGDQKTPERTYDWDDINIQTGVGDTVIDLSYTVLPKGETVIFIRNIIGNIQILVPYDLEVSVHHCVVVGSVNILNYHGAKVFNQNIHVQTPGFDKSEQKIKIFTSLIVGDIEVRRI